VLAAHHTRVIPSGLNPIVAPTRTTGAVQVRKPVQAALGAHSGRRMLDSGAKRRFGVANLSDLRLGGSA